MTKWWRGCKMDSDLGFERDDKADYELAKHEICNMLDDPGWGWLRSQINDQRLTWPDIMDLVEAHR